MYSPVRVGHEAIEAPPDLSIQDIWELLDTHEKDVQVFHDPNSSLSIGIFRAQSPIAERIWKGLSSGPDVIPAQQRRPLPDAPRKGLGEARPQPASSEHRGREQRADATISPPSSQQYGSEPDPVELTRVVDTALAQNRPSGQSVSSQGARQGRVQTGPPSPKRVVEGLDGEGLSERSLDGGVSGREVANVGGLGGADVGRRSRSEEELDAEEGDDEAEGRGRKQGRADGDDPDEEGAVPRRKRVRGRAYLSAEEKAEIEAWFKQNWTGSERLPVCLQREMVCMAKAVGGHEAAVEWHNLLRRWRTNQTLQVTDTGRPGSRGLNPLPKHIAVLAQPLQAVYRGLQVGIETETNQTFFAIQERFRLASLHQQVMEAIQLIQATATAEPRKRGESKYDQERKALFLTLNPQFRNIRNIVKDSRTASAYKSTLRELRLAHKWWRLGEKLGKGVLGLIPREVVGELWIRELSEKKWDAWLMAIEHFQPYCRRAGEIWLKLIQRALDGGKPPRNPRQIEAYRADGTGTASLVPAFLDDSNALSDVEGEGIMYGVPGYASPGGLADIALGEQGMLEVSKGTREIFPWYQYDIVFTEDDVWQPVVGDDSWDLDLFGFPRVGEPTLM
jgi:hypothetical protein